MAVIHDSHLIDWVKTSEYFLMQRIIDSLWLQDGAHHNAVDLSRTASPFSVTALGNPGK